MIESTRYGMSHPKLNFHFFIIYSIQQYSSWHLLDHNGHKKSTQSKISMSHPKPNFNFFFHNILHTTILVISPARSQRTQEIHSKFTRSKIQHAISQTKLNFFFHNILHTAILIIAPAGSQRTQEIHSKST